MIGKISHNASFYHTVAYVLDKTEARLIGGNMVGDSVAALAQEFKLSLALKPAIKRPVFHVSLSLPCTDELGDHPFAELAKDYLNAMGFHPFEHQYVAAVHTDTKHRHIHIVASRINVRTGQLASDSYERYRSQQIIRQLEQKYKLTTTRSSWDVRAVQQQYAADIGGLVRQIWLRQQQPSVIEGNAYRVEFSDKSQTLRVYRRGEDQAIVEIKNVIEKPQFKRGSGINESDYKYFASIIAQARSQNQPSPIRPQNDKKGL